MTGDDVDDIIAPSDVHYICAYKGDGTILTASTRYSSKPWGKNFRPPFHPLKTQTILVPFHRSRWFMV